LRSAGQLADRDCCRRWQKRTCLRSRYRFRVSRLARMQTPFGCRTPNGTNWAASSKAANCARSDAQTQWLQTACWRPA
jgi:hypothetical protein